MPDVPAGAHVARDLSPTQPGLLMRWEGSTYPLWGLGWPAELLAQFTDLVRQLEHFPAEGVLLRQVLRNLRLGCVPGGVGLPARQERREDSTEGAGNLERAAGAGRPMTPASSSRSLGRTAHPVPTGQCPGPPAPQPGTWSLSFCSCWSWPCRAFTFSL